MLNGYRLPGKYVFWNACIVILTTWIIYPVEDSSLVYQSQTLPHGIITLMDHRETFQSLAWT